MNRKLAVSSILIVVAAVSGVFLSAPEGKSIDAHVYDGIGLFLTPYSQSNGIAVTGAYDLTVYDETGNIKSQKHVDNLVVDIGVQTIADQMFPNIDLNGSTQNQFSYLRIGTNSTAPLATHTDIQTSIGGCSAVQDTSVEGSFASNTATIIVNGTFSGATCAGTIEEVVVANASTGGQILSRALTGSTVVGAADTLNLTYTFTVKDDGV